MTDHRPVGLFERIGHELAAQFIYLALTAVAGCIALVALSYAIYAGLETVVPPAAASALTALLFALICLVMAAVLPRLIKPANEAPVGVRLDQGAARKALSFALLALDVVADVMNRRSVRKSAATRR